MLDDPFATDLNPIHVRQLAALAGQTWAPPKNCSLDESVDEFVHSMVGRFGLSEGAELSVKVLKAPDIHDALDILKDSLIPRLRLDGGHVTRTLNTYIEGATHRGKKMNDTGFKEPSDLEAKAAAIAAKREETKAAKAAKTAENRAKMDALKAEKKAAKEAAKAAKAAGSTERKGRTSEFAGKLIKLTAAIAEKGNPRKVGTFGHKSMEIIINAGGDGIRYEEFASEGGRPNDLRWDIDKGHVTVE